MTIHSRHSAEFWMQEALNEARLCLREPSSLPDDVPIGALCVKDNQIISRGHNRREVDKDPTAHAEILALREAAVCLDDWHLHGVTLYVTLEPCPMCAGALWLSRIERVVFGAWDARAGACGSVFDVPRDPRLNHRPQVRGGVLENECAALLHEFFHGRR
jgi:tRNA(adenine34) deaminase